MTSFTKYFYYLLPLYDGISWISYMYKFREMVMRFQEIVVKNKRFYDSAEIVVLKKFEALWFGKLEDFYVFKVNCLMWMNVVLKKRCYGFF